ncbi:methyltransferase domain-containing protein [Pontixanthobacter sp. CEM42]|uniref:methyltransferase domain-containing protein n=1 Tax=Pontixanthobacter sp. CEM42 TaxID=2792077 RepID=UPI001ADF5A1C|nr:methyltransferase domain-containing protein [Pontixanthobacter sp. CEM42]
MNNPNNRPTARLLAEAGFSLGMRVLDIGCGNGLLAREIAKLVGPHGHVLGIDLQDTALEQARSHPAEDGAAPVEYRKLDLNTETLDETFDAISCRRVLMYLPDAQATLTRLASLLEPEGFIAIQEQSRLGMPIAGQPIPMHEKAHRWIWDAVEGEGADTSIGFKLAAMLQASGLTMQELWAEAIVLDSRPESDFAPLVSIMKPRLIAAGIPETDIDELISDMPRERQVLESPILYDMAFLAIAHKPA